MAYPFWPIDSKIQVFFVTSLRDLVLSAKPISALKSKILSTGWRVLSHVL